MVKRAIAPLFLIVVLIVAAGCVPAAQQSNTIKIGLQAPLTGDYAYEGKGFQNSVQLLVDQTNNAGGINGQKLQLIVEDDKGDPKEASLVADRMVSNGVKAVIGGYNSGATAPASAIYNKAGILQITPSSTRTDLSAQGFQRFFRVCYLDNQQAPSLPVS
jgi:branched-chain amino acid transport system substrate-binding protein